MLSGYYTLKVLEAAGLPPGVINFLPGDPARSRNATARLPGSGRHPFHRQHRGVQRDVEEDRREHRPLPRLSATGWRNRRQRLHRRAPLGRSNELAVAIARGGFEYQGQKCSAASRVYIPHSLWNEVRERTVAMMKEIKIGDVARLPQFHGRGDRPEGVHEDQRVSGRREAECEGHCGRHRKGRRGLLHRAHADRDDGSGLSARCAKRSSALS